MALEIKLIHNRNLIDYDINKTQIARHIHDIMSLKQHYAKLPIDKSNSK